ncbi:MAG: hypothetical protein Q9201_002813 [Fulgogasparrea decipioides]
MTEPEELDEDLFADLYDADEPSTTSVPQAQPSQVPSPVEAAPPVTPGPPPNETGQDSNNDNSITVTDHNQSTYANGQDDRENSRWDNDGRGSRMDVAVEQDSGAIGIKEDG